MAHNDGRSFVVSIPAIDRLMFAIENALITCEESIAQMESLENPRVMEFLARCHQGMRDIG